MAVEKKLIDAAAREAIDTATNRAVDGATYGAIDRRTWITIFNVIQDAIGPENDMAHDIRVAVDEVLESM